MPVKGTRAGSWSSTPPRYRRPRRRPRRLRERGCACYQLFISGLLDTSSDSVDHATAKALNPPEVVRRDGDDACGGRPPTKVLPPFRYAPTCRQVPGSWLGDAFASGGSVGYDHRPWASPLGAWASNGSEWDHTQAQVSPSVRGVSDMSGDVFGTAAPFAEQHQG